MVGLYSDFGAFQPAQKQSQQLATPGFDENGKRIIDPFDPEASVPLPFQLDDNCGPFVTSVWKRNERERYRVRCVNEGYERLRLHLPLNEQDKRISKVDTLRLAIRYIQHLSEVLRGEEHLLRCTCFTDFREESEGNVVVDIRAKRALYGNL